MSRTTVYFTDSTGFGGAEQVLLTVLRGLDRRRWRPVLLHHGAPGLAPLISAARQLGVEQQVVPRMAGRSAIPGMMRLLRLLHRLKPAVFHANLHWPLAARFGLISAALAQIPALVATEHLWIDVPWRRSIRVQQQLCRMVDRYIAVSHDLARHLREKLGFPEHKVQVIHNGIPLERYAVSGDLARSAALPGGVGRPVVLTPARLDQQKGHRFLLEAAAQVPGATYLIAGEGPERAELERQANSLGVREHTHFLGHRQDIPELLACCDLVVLPSLFEGLPLVALEAMAAGKAVIATDVGGVSEAVIHGKTGMLVPPADARSLANALRFLLDNPVAAQQLGINGHKRVQQEFTAEIMVQRIVDLYDTLLASPRRGRSYA